MMSHPLASNCIADLETISGTIANIVKNSFGPEGQVTLMSSSTGHVSLSSDGLTILSSLHLSHPSARSIVNSMASFTSQYGDGCKSMAIYLSSLFSAMGKEADKHGLTSAVGGETFLRGALSRCLLSFLSVDLPFVIDEMTLEIGHKMSEEMKVLKVESIFYSIIKTILNGVLPEPSLSHYAKVITVYLTQGCYTVKDTMNLCQWFENSVFLVPHQMYLSSYTSSGIYLTSRFFSGKSSLNNITFICMECSIDGGSDDNDKDIIHLKTSEVLVSHRFSVVEQFLSFVKKLEISLIVCASKVKAFCLQLCQAWDIAVIDCVDEADLAWICSLCDKIPVTRIREQIEERHLMKATSCDKVTFGQKSYTKIILNETFCHPKSIFLCAPSEGICQQLKIKTKRCMTLVEQLLNGSSREQEQLTLTAWLYSKGFFNITIGGGYFETLLHDYLRGYCEKNYSSKIALCCSLLQTMLMAVPKILYSRRRIMHNQSHNSHKFLDSVSTIHHLNLMKCGGINHNDDNSIQMDDTVLEVLSVKVASVFATVSLAVVLLRMDKIIGVSGSQREEKSNDDFKDT